jgi:catechol 2,3-dioxygenase-like lactoylglutathione lyase family enzyme
MKIGIVDVFVDDQERARDFYTGKLGLEVKNDAAYGDSGGWLTVVSERQAMGYGGIDAVSEDGCGNLLNLHQDSAAAGGT